MPVFLLHYPEKKKRWRVEVAGDRFVIGRSREAQVCIPLASVSKQHALVERKGERYLYRDLGSKNGLYLNGFRLDKGALEDGDELRVGSVLVQFYAGAPPAPLASPPLAEPPLADPARPDEPPLEAEAPFDGSATVALPAAVVADLAEASAELPAEPPPEAPLEEPIEPPRELPRRRPAPTRPQPQTPRRFSTGTLVIGMLIALGAGFALGHLASFLDPAPPPSQDTAGEDAKSDAKPGAPPAAVPAAAGAPQLTNPLGVADLSQPETARRLCVRLFLDLAERSPTAAELKRIAALTLEKQWDAIRSQAAAPFDPPADKLDSACEKLLGRKPTPDEHEKLRALAEGDPSWYAFHVGTSAEYARADRRRPRSDRQLVRSLHVDLTGETPTVAEEKALLLDLEAAKKSGEAAPTLGIARGLIESGRAARAAPPASGDAAGWLDDIYARLLLRSPTADEKTRTLAAMAKGGAAWKAVVLEMVTRGEYLEY